MAALTLGDLKVLVRNMLADNVNYTPTVASSVTANSFSDEQVRDAINWAAKRYVDRKSGTPNTVVAATRSTTTARFTLPDTLNGVIRVLYVFTSDGTSDPRLVKSSLEMERLENIDFNVTTPTNTGAKRWMYSSSGMNEIILGPGVPTGTTSVEVHVVDAPNTLSLDADTLNAQYVPIAAQEHLRFAAAAWLLQSVGDQQDIALADKWLEQFNSLIASYGV